MKKYTTIGLIVGITLAFAIIFGQLPGLLWVLLFGGIGVAIGAHYDGRIDLAAIFSGNGRNGRG